MMEYTKYDSPISPQSFMGVIHKRRKLILVLFSVIVVSLIGVTFIMPPVYRSTAKVMVKYQADNSIYVTEGYRPTIKVPYDQLASEVLIFKTRSILEPVVSTLGLDSVETDETETIRRHDEAVEELSKKLKVEREKDTNVFLVSYEDSNPRLAANVVDKVVTEYIAQRPSIDRDDRAYEFFDNQIRVIERRISEMEKKGLVLQNQHKMMLPDKQSEILFSSVARFDEELTKIRAERISKEARLRIIKDQLNSSKDIFIPTTETTESLGKQEYLNLLKKTLLTLELRKSSLEKKYTPKHPELAQVLDDIRETRAKLRAEVEDIIRVEETNIKALRAAEDALAQRMGQVVNSIAMLTKENYELDRLTIGIDDLRHVHSMLVRQREEARIAASKKEYSVQVRLLEPALVPHTPVKPNKPLYAALAILLGFVVSFGFAFFLEYFDHSVNTVEDARNCLGLPILAAIPEIQVRHPHNGFGANGREAVSMSDLNAFESKN